LKSRNPDIKKTGQKATETITGNYEVLQQMYNCLNTILHEFDYLLPCTGGPNSWVESNNMISIGCWQYTRAINDSKPTSKTEISELNPTHDDIQMLEDCPWEIVDHAVANVNDYNDNKNDMSLYYHFARDNKGPKWLLEERNYAIRAHSYLKELNWIIDSNYLPDNEFVKQCKLDLKKGKLSRDEYYKMIESDQKAGGEEMRLQANAPDAETEKASNSKGFAYSAMKRIVQMVQVSQKKKKEELLSQNSIEESIANLHQNSSAALSVLEEKDDNEFQDNVPFDRPQLKQSIADLTRQHKAPRFSTSSIKRDSSNDFLVAESPPLVVAVNENEISEPSSANNIVNIAGELWNSAVSTGVSVMKTPQKAVRDLFRESSK
jgi:hypothetical protein